MDPILHPNLPDLLAEILKIPSVEVIRNDYDYCIKHNLSLPFEYVYFALKFETNRGGFVFDIVWDQGTNTCDCCWIYCDASDDDYKEEFETDPYYKMDPLEFLLTYWSHREVLPFYLNLLQERNDVPC